MAESWAPGVADVAQHVPTRTRDRTQPGSDKMLLTFNGNTTPTDGAVQQLIDDAVGGLLALTGPLPVNVPEQAQIQTLAKSYVEWRTAADIEVAYPNRDADLQVSDRLAARAALVLTQLQQAIVLSLGPGYTPDVLPSWSFPDPPPWGDVSPGSGVEQLTKTTLPGGQL